MIHTNNPNQMTFIDPLEEFGPKRKKLLEGSWAYFFRHHILPEIPVQKVTKHFSRFGRPSKELYSSLGVLILQQTFDLTDKDILYQLAFSSQWHYALNIIHTDDDSTYMCEKTLYNTRNIILQNNLWETLFNSITGSLIEQFNVDTSKQRLDSTHIQSNMKSLGRIGVFSQTIHKFLTNLKRQHRPLFDQLSEALVTKYLKKKQLSAFSMVKPSESAKNLKSLSKDLYHLVQRFEINPKITQMKSFALLKRVLDEQCEIVTNDNFEKNQVTAKPKPSKKVPCDSLQNPSDPDASYSGHKGKGYQVQVMETWSEDKSDKTPNLITHVAIEPAHNHDSKATIPAIESTEQRGIKPKEILADALYGSDENTQEAKQLGVDLISPTLDGASKSDIFHLNDFHFNGKNRITFCPNNKQPISQRIKNETVLTKFNLNHCNSCSLREKCPVKNSKKNTYIRYHFKDVRLAKRRQFEKTPAFIKKYVFRAGVEATMAEYKQITGVNKLRVRGIIPVSFCATLKALGINILRSAKAFNNLELSPLIPSNLRINHTYSILLLFILTLISKKLLRLEYFRKISLKNYFFPNFNFSTRVRSEFSF